MKTRVIYPKAPEDGKTLAFLCKGEGSQMGPKLKLPADTILQWGPCGSYRMDTNRAYYKWMVEECTDTAYQTLYIADDASFNRDDDDLHAFFDDKNQMFEVMFGGVTGRIQPCDTRNHGPFAQAYRKEEVHDGHEALLHGATVVPADKQPCINRSMIAWRALPHLEFAKGFTDAGIANDLHGNDDHHMSSDIASLWKDMGMSKRRGEIGAWVKERVDHGSLSTWLQ